VPSLKVGPGDSARSHTADEFIYVSELEEAVQLYIALLTPVITTRA
jgi:acetylornithine deacetylase